MRIVSQSRISRCSTPLEVRLAPSSPTTKVRPLLDRIGIVASVACAIHCLAAPALLLVAPFLSGWWSHPATHGAIALVVLPVAILGLRSARGRRGGKWIFGSGIVGIALVLLGALLPLWSADATAEEGAHSSSCCPSVKYDDESQRWDWNLPPASIVTLLGGVALVLAHAGNLRCCRDH